MVLLEQGAASGSFNASVFQYPLKAGFNRNGCSFNTELSGTVERSWLVRKLAQPMHKRAQRNGVHLNDLLETPARVVTIAYLRPIYAIGAVTVKACL